MTGYGRAAKSNDGIHITAEIRTVNGRFLDVKTRLPNELATLEAEVRGYVQSRLHRGRAEVWVQIDIQDSGRYELNEPLVENYRTLAEKAACLGIKGELQVLGLLQLPGILLPRQFSLSSDRLRETLLQCLEEALREVIVLREREGESLEADIGQRLNRLRDLLSQIEEHSEDICEHYRKKLLEKISRLDDSGPVEESRLAQEVLYYAERADISEETTRLRSHLVRFREVTVSKSEGSIGKNLDFLCQEMNREMNTIVSKSPLAEISEIAVQGKVEIEKIREQVQNVE